MLIKYVGPLDKLAPFNPKLPVGKIYEVLSINFKASNKPHMVLIKDESHDSPFLVNIEYFNIVDRRIPEGWDFSPEKSGSYTFEPHEFGGDFWDLYHDGDPEAETTLTKVIKRTKDFHSTKD